MTSSHNKYDAIETLIFNEGLMIKSLEFSTDNSTMYVHLTNKTTFVISTNNYRNLKKATSAQLRKFRLIANGTGIHWPDLDEDLSLKGFFNELLRQLVSKENELVIS